MKIKLEYNIDENGKHWLNFWDTMSGHDRIVEVVGDKLYYDIFSNVGDERIETTLASFLDDVEEVFKNEHPNDSFD